MWALLLVLGAARAEVLAVDHQGEVRGDSVAWTTRVIVDAPVHRLDLAVPLPAEAELLPQAGTAIERDGAIVGFAFDPPVNEAVLRTRQALHPGDGLLAAPIVDTPALQRLAVDGGSFAPDPALEFGRTLDDLRQPGIDGGAARRTDRLIDDRVKHPAYFVAGPRLRDAGGLAGEIRTGGASSAVVWLALAGCVATVAAAWASWRALAKVAEAESVDAYIKKEFVK